MKSIFFKNSKLLSLYIALFASAVFAVYYISIANNESIVQMYGKDGEILEINAEEYQEKMKEEVKEKRGFKRKPIDPQEYANDINLFLSTPTEPETDAINNWVFKGPFGAKMRDNSATYCGLIRDIEVEGVPNVRVAGNSGGLFKVVAIFPYALADDQVTTRNMGAFATDPNNSQVILLGTGNAYFPGTGLWRTTNEGVNWTQITSIPQINWFTEIKYQTGSSMNVLASHHSGLYRSTNGGLNWTISNLSGEITWFDFAEINPTIVYASKRSDGVYKSTNGGQSFSRVNSYPLTTGNFNWATLTVSKNNPNLVYVSATNDIDQTSGIHKSTNGGNNWTDISWRIGGVLQNMHTQGIRNGCISVCPTNDQLILVGGFDIYRTTNAGVNWAIVPGQHKDQSVFKWRSNGTQVYVGNDGGLAYSTNAGATFSTDVGIIPVMEVLSVDVAAYPGGFIFLCGTQDNSIISSINNGALWYVNVNSDGGRVSIDRNNPTNWMGLVFPGSPVGHSLHYSTNSGAAWTPQTINTSLYSTTVANDMTSPVYWYNNTGNKVYYKTSISSSWLQLGPALPETQINAISVGKYSGGYTPVYAVLEGPTNKIKIFDGTNWVVRNSGLPASSIITDVSNHPTNNNVAVCYTGNASLPGQKIYKTTNRGVSWNNITGDFPDLKITSAVMHPTNNNIMFASVKYSGVYRTTNGGVNWFRWMNGMPLTLWVESMTHMDSTAINGKFYIVAGSHGRGVWVRDASGDDPITGIQTHSELPSQYSLNQNFPNPFNPSTNISFSLPVDDHVNIQIFDITGKLVKEVTNKIYKAGNHEIKINGSNLSSGSYFYRLTTPKFSDVKKMILVR